MRLGNIVHQGASVMGSSLWQWSSGHKSKRAYKHHMTDGWEDSFGQGGRDGEREIKWARGRRTELEERSQAGLLSLRKSLKCWMVYECPCSMSAVKGKTRTHRGNASQLTSDKKPSNEQSRCKIAQWNSWSAEMNANYFVSLQWKHQFLTFVIHLKCCSAVFYAKFNFKSLYFPFFSFFSLLVSLTLFQSWLWPISAVKHLHHGGCGLRKQINGKSNMKDVQA